jgi:hypothetical protein
MDAAAACRLGGQTAYGLAVMPETRRIAHIQAVGGLLDLRASQGKPAVRAAASMIVVYEKTTRNPANF